MVQGVDSKAGEGDVASTAFPLCRIEKKARRRIEFTPLIIVKVDFHWHVIFTCEHTLILRT